MRIATSPVCATSGLKPENVMLTADGLVKIVDFGMPRRPAQVVTRRAAEVVAT